jgi:hypothetical protein
LDKLLAAYRAERDALLREIRRQAQGRRAARVGLRLAGPHRAGPAAFRYLGFVEALVDQQESQE